MFCRLNNRKSLSLAKLLCFAALVAFVPLKSTSVTESGEVLPERTCPGQSLDKSDSSFDLGLPASEDLDQNEGRLKKPAHWREFHRTLILGGPEALAM